MNEENLIRLDNIKIPGEDYTWYEIDRVTIPDELDGTITYYLMENNELGDEIYHIVMTDDFNEVYYTEDDLLQTLADEDVISYDDIEKYSTLVEGCHKKLTENEEEVIEDRDIDNQQFADEIKGELIENHYFEPNEILDIYFKKDEEPLYIRTAEGTKKYGYMGGRLYDWDKTWEVDALDNEENLDESKKLKEDNNTTNRISQEERDYIDNIIERECKLWSNAPKVLSSYMDGTDYVVEMDNSNSTYLSSLWSEFRNLEDKYNIGFDRESNDNGFYGYTYTFYHYEDDETEPVDESLKEDIDELSLQIAKLKPEELKELATHNGNMTKAELECLAELANLENFDKVSIEIVLDKYRHSIGEDLFRTIKSLLSKNHIDESLSEAKSKPSSARLVWDDCTPTRDRRPTTEEDIEDDINVRDLSSAEELYELLLELANYEDEDLEMPDATIEEKIEAVLESFMDPGDGSPNIFYAAANGHEFENVFPYDCLEDLDLATCTYDDIVDAIKSDYDFESDEDDEDEDDEYDSKVKVGVFTIVDGNILYRCDKTATNAIIPNSVKSISWYAFSDCTRLTSVTIPDSVTEIPYGAFYGCTSLTNVTIPNSVTKIGSGAFRNCINLKNVTIPNNVINIGGGTFDGCTSLTIVTIPNKLTGIDAYMFQNCRNLTSITIPDSVTSIGDYAFGGCKNLTNITFTGTQTQWKAINKREHWNDNTNKYTIHCKDGDIKKDTNESLEEDITNNKLDTPRGTFDIYPGTWKEFKEDPEYKDWGMWFEHFLPEDADWKGVTEYYKIMSDGNHPIAVLFMKKEPGAQYGKITEKLEESLTEDDNNSNSYQGNDYVREIFIDWPLEDVIDELGTKDVEKLYNYYIEMNEESNEKLSSSQKEFMRGYIEELLKDLETQTESLTEDLDEKEQAIREVAEEAWRYNDKIDNFEEFKDIFSEDEFEVTEDDYNKYIKFIDEFKANMESNLPSEKEIQNFLKELGSYADYNQKIDDLMDEFGMDKETAESYVWDDASGLYDLRNH